MVLRHGAAGVVPEAVEELGLLLSKLRVLPPPRRRPRERRGVIAEVATKVTRGYPLSGAATPHDEQPNRSVKVRLGTLGA